MTKIFDLYSLIIYNVKSDEITQSEYYDILQECNIRPFIMSV